jgi:4-hydroxybutyrate dehydrogenase/sulfolactaldehyde 3-reductase
LERIGFVGLGAMGAPMASNLARKGFPLTVFDRLAQPMAALATLGAKTATSIAELTAQVDIVVTMLPDSPDVADAVLGPSGVLAHGRKGQIVMDMSTVDPSTSDRMAQALEARGLGFVDAPVGRLVAHAIKGESLFMVGARDADFARAEPLLKAMGTAIHRCGGPGAGMRMKLVNNYLAIVSCQMSAEALTLATKMGLDLKTTLEVVNGTTATNGHLKNAFPSKVLAGDVAPGFRIALAHKDISLALEAAHKAGAPVLTGAAAREAIGLAKGLDDYAAKDFSALFEVACRFAGVRTPRL